MKNKFDLIARLLLIVVSITTNSFCSLSQTKTLFINGDFEQYTSSHSHFSNVTSIKGIIPCSYSPDYFNDCKLTTNCYRTITPFSGDGCLGMFAGGDNGDNQKNETAIAILDNPTVSGEEYVLDFYLCGEKKNTRRL